MAEFAKLGVTKLNTAPYTLLEVSFPPPKQEVTSRDFAKKDGAQILRERYRNSVRKMRVQVQGSSKDNMHELIQTIQDQINTQDVVLEYIPDNSSNSNFSDVLVGSKDNKIDLKLVQSNTAIVVITVECKPFWRATELTIASQTLSPTPSKITLGNIKGDVNAPCSIEVAAVGANSIGTNLVLGSREFPMNEGQFTPIKDFQGSTLAGAFNGKATDTTVDTSWTSLTGVDTNINGIAAESATVQVAVGDGGKIFTTANGWGTVSDIAHGLTTQDLNGISYAGGTTYYACGNNGVVLKSTDSGANWSVVATGHVDNINSIFATSTSVVNAVGENGRFMKTGNGGSSWSVNQQRANGGIFPNLTDLFMANANDGFVVTSTDMTGFAATSQVWVTSDGFINTTTSSLSVASGIAWYSISGWSANDVVAVGEGGIIRLTDDGWSTSSGPVSGISDDLLSVVMQSSTVGWACGNNGVALYTDDSAVTWTQQTTNTSSQLNSVAVVDANNVNIAGDGYTVLDTDDAGTTWTRPIAAWALTSDYDGRHDVYARIKKSSTGSGQMRVSVGWGGGTFITQAQVDVTAGSDLQTVYLGEIAIPATTISDSVSASRAIKVEGQMDAGSETWSSDVFWIVPIDGETAQTTAAATASSHITFDSDKNAVNQGSTIITWIGSPPLLRPGQNNLVICETAGIDGAVVIVKYEPLYLLPVA